MPPIVVPPASPASAVESGVRRRDAVGTAVQQALPARFARSSTGTRFTFGA